MKVRLDHHPNYWGTKKMFQTISQLFKSFMLFKYNFPTALRVFQAWMAISLPIPDNQCSQTINVKPEGGNF